MQAIKHIIQKLGQLFYAFLSLPKKGAFWQKFIKVETRLKARYTRLPRLRYMALTGLVLFSACIPTINTILKNQPYHLSDEVRALVGKPNKALASKLSYNADKDSWQFNKDGVPIDSNTAQTAEMPSLAQLKAQLGGGGEKDESLYAVDMPSDGRKGVTYYDTNTNLAFTLKPQFNVAQLRKSDANLVYAAEKDVQLVYTPKANGMKEDIILNKPIGDVAEFRYALNLPDELEAKVRDDGSLGIYSPNPTLFGTIGATQDREKILSARQSATKDHLLFVLPAPVIVEKGGNKASAAARFVLTGDMLTIKATQLQHLSYPLSIDPSVVVTSSSDFANGSGDSIDYTVDGQVGRTELRVGTGLWRTTTPISTATQGLATVATNGYMYTLGGVAASTAVRSAPINSDGTLGSWTPTSSLNTARAYHGAAAWNGYMYVWGGYNTSTNAATSSVEYAPINSDGTLGVWQTTTSMNTAVCRGATASYQGYIYSFGGSTTPTASCGNSSNGATSTVQYAPIKADGTVGTWQTTTSIGYGSSGQVIAPMAGAYGGYMYLMGGMSNAAATTYSNVQYAVIHDDGTLGGWTATTSLPAATHSAGASTYGGYIYMFSDQASGTAARYAPLFAGGQVGPWASSGLTLTQGRWGASAAMYGKYAYYIGGAGPSSTAEYSLLQPEGRTINQTLASPAFTSSRERGASTAYGACVYLMGGYAANGNNYVNYTQYTRMDANGVPTMSWPNQSFNGLGRADLAAVAYNGYLYSIGGYSGQTNTYYNTVQYAAINDDCSLGTWTNNATSFDTAGRGGITAFAYNGYMYVTGGIGSGGNSSAVRYAPINSDGSVGTWASTTALSSAMNRHQTVVWGNHLYVLGGTTLALPNPNNGATTGSRPTGSGSTAVRYTTINDDGTLGGSWSTGTSLPYDVYEFGATVQGDYLYMGGGFTSTGSGISQDFYVASIASNGSLGSWIYTYDRGSGFPVASFGMVESNGYQYIIGGRSDTGIGAAGRLVNVVRSERFLGGSGQTKAWQSSGSLATGRGMSGSTAYNGYVYVVGGSTNGGTSARTDVEYSAINNQDGSLGSFTADTHNLSNGRALPGAAAWNGRLYVVGGGTNSTRYGDVQSAPIGDTGALSGAFSTANSFVTGTGGDTGRVGVCTVAYDGRLYAIGGYDGTNYHNDVRYATINSNGSLGSWNDSGNTIAGGRSSAGCFAAAGYMYMLGGRDATSNYSDVQMAEIQSNGSLGTWRKTTSFRGGRAQFVAGYSNGFVYLYGGCTTTACSAGYGDVQYAVVHHDGTIGEWQYRPSTETTYTPYQTTGVVYDGYMYQLGGSGAASTSSTSYAPLMAMARQGRYSKLVDLGALAQVSSITWNGKLANSYAPGAAPVRFRSARDDGSFGTLVPSGSIIPGGAPCQTADPAYARYVLVDVALDDSIMGGLASDNTTNAYLTDLTINYSPTHPTPETRLRGGKTLQDGTLSPLDTCQG